MVVKRVEGKITSGRWTCVVQGMTRDLRRVNYLFVSLLGRQRGHIDGVDGYRSFFISSGSTRGAPESNLFEPPSRSTLQHRRNQQQ